MNKILSRREALSKVPFFAFMVNIIDPEEENELEDIASAVIDKFNLKAKPNNFHTINSLVAKHVDVESRKDLFVELPVYGFIRIYKVYKLLKYKEHTFETDIYSLIEVNSKEIDTRPGFDNEKMLALKDTLEVLYSSREKEYMSWSDIFELCWKMFEKGNRSDALKAFHDACEELINNDENSIDEDIAHKFTHWAKWIKIKWDYYLWEKHEANTNTDFVLGLREFINRNLQSWIENREMHKIKINVYSYEHDLAIDYFNSIEEPYLYYAAIKDYLYGT